MLRCPNLEHQLPSAKDSNEPDQWPIHQSIKQTTLSYTFIIHQDILTRHMTRNVAAAKQARLAIPSAPGLRVSELYGVSSYELKRTYSLRSLCMVG